MTWIRLDTDFPRHELVGALATALKIRREAAAFALIGAWCGFGDFQQDGRADAISDMTLEDWAGWRGKAGHFAAAFRKFCVEEDGKVKGWWRQEALLRHQSGKGKRPGKDEREYCEEIAKDLRENCAKVAPERRPIYAGDVDVDGNSNGTNQTTTGGGANRLVNALGRDTARFTVMALFEHLPPEESPDAWAGVLLSCLQGGMAQGKSATVAQLAAACADFPAVVKGKWSPRHFRACVESAMRGEKVRPGRPGTAKMLAEAAAWTPPDAT